MKKKISDFFKKIGDYNYLLARKIYLSPLEIRSALEEQRCSEWLKIQGDKNLRLNYNLNENGIVFDLGGFEGQWTSDIYSKYGCNIYIFEPMPEFANKIKQRFLRNKKIFVYDFGLSDKICKEKLFVSNDSSSIFKQSSNSIGISLVNATQFLQENNIQHIDLMKINIEGGEYILLEHLIETGFINKIDNIQVQFHDCIPDAEEQMRKIQIKLEKTHSITYQYLFVWENWIIKNFDIEKKFARMEENLPSAINENDV